MGWRGRLTLMQRLPGVSTAAFEVVVGEGGARGASVKAESDGGEGGGEARGGASRNPGNSGGGYVLNSSPNEDSGRCPHSGREVNRLPPAAEAVG